MPCITANYNFFIFRSGVDGGWMMCSDDGHQITGSSMLLHASFGLRFDRSPRSTVLWSHVGDEGISLVTKSCHDQ